MRTPLIVLLLASAACAHKTMGDQVADFKTKAAGSKYLFANNYAVAGSVNAELLADTDDGDRSQTPGGSYSVHWGGSDGTKACVYLQEDEPQNGGDTSKHHLRRYNKVVAVTPVAFGAYDSWDSVPTEYPAKPPVHPANHVVDEGVTSKVHTESDGKKRTRYTTHAELWTCGTAPAVTPSTRIITAVVWDYEVGPGLFAWNVNGSPAASAPVVAPVAASPEPAAATASGVESGKNLVESLTAAKGYLGFLTVVDCAGKRDELANGNFNVLAFSDQTIVRVIPDKKERLGIRKKPELCLAIYNAHVSKRVTLDGGTLTATGLDGKAREVKVDASLPVMNTTNGTIYPVPEMWRP